MEVRRAAVASERNALIDLKPGAVGLIDEEADFQIARRSSAVTAWPALTTSPGLK